MREPLDSEDRSTVTSSPSVVSLNDTLDVNGEPWTFAVEDKEVESGFGVECPDVSDFGGIDNATWRRSFARSIASALPACRKKIASLPSTKRRL